MFLLRLFVIALLPYVAYTYRQSFGESYGETGCANPPLPNFQPDPYIPRGTICKIFGMDVYETGDLTATKVLIVVYDVFGNNHTHQNIKQIADYYGDLGYKVILPDFFRGTEWLGGDVDPHNNPEVTLFLTLPLHSWNNRVKDDLELLFRIYKHKGATGFGILGFCFGAPRAATASHTFPKYVRVIGQIHNLNANLEETLLIKTPTLMVNGADDLKVPTYCDAIRKNLNDPNGCEYYQFPDVNHGFAGAFADWANKTILTRAEQSIKLFQEFLSELTDDETQLSQKPLARLRRGSSAVGNLLENMSTNEI